MELRLVRQPSDDKRTHGDLYMDGQWCAVTMEDPVRDEKIPGETAIPAGKYKVIMSDSPRFKRRLPLLLNVPQFSGVRIHSGNDHTETDGCLLVGQRRSSDRILDSKAALEDLVTEIEAAIQGGEEVFITIEDEKFAYG